MVFGKEDMTWIAESFEGLSTLPLEVRLQRILGLVARTLASYANGNLKELDFTGRKYGRFSEYKTDLRTRFAEGQEPNRAQEDRVVGTTARVSWPEGDGLSAGWSTINSSFSLQYLVFPDSSSQKQVPLAEHRVQVCFLALLRGKLW